ncbi:MAG: hypothetical protein QOD13_1006 [Thermoleophilaceae bacterium]|nr:hypothetical protein [Thermoleophilaceae bacterium]
MDGSNGMGPRLLLVAAVAMACVLTGVGFVSLLGGGASVPDPARAKAASVAMESPRAQASHAHSGDLGVRGMSERELRAMETITLGPEHAREHALLRRAVRREDAAGGPQGENPLKAAAVAEALPAVDPAEDGDWNPQKAFFPIVAIHAALLPTGKVMIFTYPAGQNSAEAWLWDPANDPSGASMVKKNPPDLDGKPANIWCAGQTFTEDGELLVFGGNLEFPDPAIGSAWKGLNKVYTFNPWTETWTEQPNMRHGRWYPTGVRMADGRVPIISGLDESGKNNPTSTNPDVELFTPPATAGGVGSVDYLGAMGGPGQPPIGGLYPHMFAMPSGRTLIAGPAMQDSWYFDSVTNTATEKSYVWSDAPDLSRARGWGTTVPLPSGVDGPTKVMALGGTNWTEVPSTTTTEVFDEAQPNLGWKPAPSNLIGRGHANTVLLPDGSMVEVGGGVGMSNTFPSPLHKANPEQRQIELWDPETGEWRLGPAQTESRAYHSTALLLPDGSVLSGGDEYNGDAEGHVDTGEIYRPPYLFRGARPTITSDPGPITSGGGFGVSTPNTNIARAALVAPAAVTHGVDMNQRVIQLDVERRVGCVNMKAPGAKAAPPGWYMLFLLNDQGVPSIARFVKLQQFGTATACTAPVPPADVTAPAVTIDAPAAGTTISGAVKVKASASDAVGVVGVQFKLGDQNLGTEDKSALYSRTWDTTKIPDGTYTLTAVARDAANATTSAPVTVTVTNPDKDGPWVSLTAPKDGATVAGLTTVSADAFDPGDHMGEVQFQVDGQNIGPPVTSPPWTVQWATTDVSNGSHKLGAVGTDTLGNSLPSWPVTVTVNNQPPSNNPPPVIEPLPKQDQPVAKPVPPTGTAGVPKNLAPGISKLRISRPTFRRGTATKISFSLSEAADVKLSFERRVSGHRAGGRCVSPPLKRRAKCTLYARVKSTIGLHGKVGSNSLLFRGKLSRTRSLATGRYRLTLQATDATGKRSAAVHTSFRLLDSVDEHRAVAVQAAVLAWF